MDCHACVAMAAGLSPLACIAAYIAATFVNWCSSTAAVEYTGISNFTPAQLQIPIEIVEFRGHDESLGDGSNLGGASLDGAVEGGALRSRSRICAIARNGTSHLHQLSGGRFSLSWTSRRRFLLALKGTVGMLGMMSTVPLQARAAGVSEAEGVLQTVQWPEQFPFSKEDFARYDESPDTTFYDSPRFVTHIDDPAIRALTKYYSSALPPSNSPGVAAPDMCSSWISHYPKGYKQERIVGLGLNEAELKKNEVLTEYVVQDLNVNPTLPFADNSFDVITNVVSVDYLAKLLEIFKEMHRVLKPGGLVAMSFSNRCFFTKAISIWTSTGDIDQVMIVGSYFHYTGGFERPRALDIAPNPGRSEPMYIVYSRKLKSESGIGSA